MTTKPLLIDEALCPKCGQAMRGPFYCQGNKLHTSEVNSNGLRELCKDGEHLYCVCPCGWQEARPCGVEQAKAEQPQAEEATTDELDACKRWGIVTRGNDSELDITPRGSFIARNTARSAAIADIRANVERVAGPLRFRVTSLASELKGVNEELAQAKRDLAIVHVSDRQGVWYWQGDGGDDLPSIACPVVMSADKLRELVDANSQAADELKSTLARRTALLREWQNNAFTWSMEQVRDWTGRCRAELATDQDGKAGA